MNETKEKMTMTAEWLANSSLEIEEFNNYSNDDLENATLIFTHFLIDVIWRENQNLTQEKKEELAETTGEAIYQLILASTGLDMIEVLKGK